MRLNGVDYAPGDDLPTDEVLQCRTVEALLSGGYITPTRLPFGTGQAGVPTPVAIPTVEWWRMYADAQAPAAPDPEPEQRTADESAPVDGPIAAVLLWVANDPVKARQALALEEQAPEPRITLLRALESVIGTETP